jgi:hypothetical protein
MLGGMDFRSKGLVCVLAFLTVILFAAAGLFAAETRGLRMSCLFPGRSLS